MSGSWGCPHELNGLCSRVKYLPCDLGMKGCVLYGRFVFANEDKNEPLRRMRDHRSGTAADVPPTEDRDAEN